MPISVACACGAAFNLKDEFAGKRLKCPKCGGVITAPALGADASPYGAPDSNAAPPPPLPLGYAAPAMQTPGGYLFGRDKFLLRQKHLSISAKYYVWDEQGQTIAFIERPAHFFRNLLALVCAALTFIVVGLGLAAGLSMLAKGNQDLQVILGIVGIVIGVAATIPVAVVLSAKRHVYFYADESRSTKLLEITQDNKFQILNAFYTVRTPEGDVLASFRKNYLYNLIRKRWYVLPPAATNPMESLAIAKEDSIILSLLRRFLGNLAGLLRTNFIILQGTSEQVMGEFNRKFTILDRYVLDMSADPGRTLDRRIALALGVMLDTGEKR